MEKMAKILDGKLLSKNIREQIATEIKLLTQQGSRPPGLAVILVGNDPASMIYVKNKRQACEEVGMKSVYHHLSSSIDEMDLIKIIQQLNEDSSIDGILLQLPLPDSIDSDKVLEMIDPIKDVDGFHPYNLGRLGQGRPLLRPCTPLGVIHLLNSIGETYINRHAVIIGASNIVGRPMALELLMAGSTVTVCHRLTEDLKPYVQSADILISAVGKPNLISGEWVKENATVIDVGITRSIEGTLLGDIEFISARKKAAWITPVPGGVGPMTVATLLGNTLFAYRNNPH